MDKIDVYCDKCGYKVDSGDVSGGCVNCGKKIDLYVDEGMYEWLGKIEMLLRSGKSESEEYGEMIYLSDEKVEVLMLLVKVMMVR